MGALGGQVQIVFNGEIYNFLELRSELESRGYRFVTHCDTEVILLGYVEWGTGCVQRLSGMFAFAIWDARSRQVLLARDRVGKKPLYYCQRGQTLAFASELKALRAGGLCPDVVDPESLDCYLTFGYIPSPRSIYKGVKKLPAGHYLEVSERDQTPSSYWRLSFAEPRNLSVDQAADELDSLLDDAVRCRLMSEVPLGVFLSGGLDSTLVASSMARTMGVPVVTNSVGFETKELDELPLARRVADYLKTDHHEFVVQPHINEVLDKIAWHFDEPFADSSAVPTWYVCEMARRNVTVALSGDGGDEPFGGYSFRYIPHVFESKIRHVVPLAARRALFGTLGWLWPRTRRLPKPLRLKTIFENLAGGDADAFYRDLIWLRDDTRYELYSEDLMESLRGFTPLETVYPWYAHSDARDALGRSQDADIHFYMSDDVLVKVDRMSMAHSLEVRSPLLDHRIIEFAARLPANLKLDSRRGKLVLRELVSRKLPVDLHNRPKRGFSAPVAEWLREDLKDRARDIIFSRNRDVLALLQPAKLKRLWDEHQSKAMDHSALLWGLMMLGLWEDHHL
jgi:asparagine synthase (glutamine-hydrolysing)